MKKFEDNGFVNFPIDGPSISRINSGKTMIYLVSFNYSGDPLYKILSNLNLKLPGTFVSDDVLNRVENKYTDEESIKRTFDENKIYDSLYFPNLKSENDIMKFLSIDLITSICIGWSNYGYESKDGNRYWYATFRDLTNEGKKLFYSIKKLHYDKEVRLLTFNNI